MRLRYLVRFLLLTAGFGLTTLGLLSWQVLDFKLLEIWPVSGELRLHPVHLMVLGLALIPPTLWEIFLLEQRAIGNRQ